MSQNKRRRSLRDSATRVRSFVAVCSVAACAALYLAIRESHHFSWWSTIGFGLLAFSAAQFPFSLTEGGLYDVSFVITQVLARLGGLVDPSRIAVAGHSDGAVTALAVAWGRRTRDPRVGAAMH